MTITDIAMTEFIDDETGYMKWLEDNPNGYVMNSFRNTSSSYLPLHRASCWTIKTYKSTAAESSFTGAGYKKLCFDSAQDVSGWMLHNYPYSVHCSHCKPDIYFSKQEYQYALDAEISESARSPSDRRKHLEIISKIPQKYTATTILYTRNPLVIAERLAIAKGICEDCKQPAPFNKRDSNEPFLEVHHVKFLSEGGEDSIENTVALCPNCHRKRHYG